MSKKTWWLAAGSGAVIGATALLVQTRIAVAAVVPTPPVTVEAVAAVAKKPVSRRERMARIVAEQAAITAEASAREALAARRGRSETAMR